MSVVLYGCETWSVMLREKHRLVMFENWETENVREDWKKLPNQELHTTISSSPDIIRWTQPMRMRWAGHVAGVGRGRIHIELEWRK